MQTAAPSRQHNHFEPPGSRHTLNSQSLGQTYLSEVDRGKTQHLDDHPDQVRQSAEAEYYDHANDDGTYTRRSLIHTVNKEDYLYGRGVNPRTGLITPGLSSGPDGRQFPYDQTRSNPPEAVNKWQARGNQWVVLGLDQGPSAGHSQRTTAQCDATRAHTSQHSADHPFLATQGGEYDPISYEDSFALLPRSLKIKRPRAGPYDVPEQVTNVSPGEVFPSQGLPQIKRKPVGSPIIRSGPERDHRVEGSNGSTSTIVKHRPNIRDTRSSSTPSRGRFRREAILDEITDTPRSIPPQNITRIYQRQEQDEQPFLEQRPPKPKPPLSSSQPCNEFRPKITEKPLPNQPMSYGRFPSPNQSCLPPPHGKTSSTTPTGSQAVDMKSRSLPFETVPRPQTQRHGGNQKINQSNTFGLPNMPMYDQSHRTKTADNFNLWIPQSQRHAQTSINHFPQNQPHQNGSRASSTTFINTGTSTQSYMPAHRVQRGYRQQAKLNAPAIMPRDVRHRRISSLPATKSGNMNQFALQETSMNSFPLRSDQEAHLRDRQYSQISPATPSKLIGPRVLAVRDGMKQHQETGHLVNGDLPRDALLQNLHHPQTYRAQILQGQGRDVSQGRMDHSREEQKPSLPLTNGSGQEMMCNKYPQCSADGQPPSINGVIRRSEKPLPGGIDTKGNVTEDSDCATSWACGDDGHPSARRQSSGEHTKAHKKSARTTREAVDDQMNTPVDHSECCPDCCVKENCHGGCVGHRRGSGDTLPSLTSTTETEQSSDFWFPDIGYLSDTSEKAGKGGFASVATAIKKTWNHRNAIDRGGNRPRGSMRPQPPPKRKSYTRNRPGGPNASGITRGSNNRSAAMSAAIRAMNAERHLDMFAEMEVPKLDDVAEDGSGHWARNHPSEFPGIGDGAHHRALSRTSDSEDVQIPSLPHVRKRGGNGSSLDGGRREELPSSSTQDKIRMIYASSQAWISAHPEAQRLLWRGAQGVLEMARVVVVTGMRLQTLTADYTVTGHCKLPPGDTVTSLVLDVGRSILYIMIILVVGLLLLRLFRLGLGLVHALLAVVRVVLWIGKKCTGQGVWY